MTNQSEEQKPQQTSTFSMIATLGGVAMLSGFLVVLVFQLTKPYIEENQRRATEEAVSKVVHGAVVQRKFVIADDGVFPFEENKEGTIVYAGYDADGTLLGIAAPAGAQGYADIITLLYGYDHTCECIRGIQVLKMAETPGLGDKIKFDSKFLKNFISLDASLNDSGDALDNPIVTVKHGSKWNDWEIDAISGATISSRAVGKALNRSAQELLPILRPHLEILRSGQPDTPEIK
jgi:Na+-translocating ferredoxin:NAD+ oxidoreductase subunit G